MAGRSLKAVELLLIKHKPLGDVDYSRYSSTLHKYMSMFDCDLELEIVSQLVKEVLGKKGNYAMLAAEIMALY